MNSQESSQNNSQIAQIKAQTELQEIAFQTDDNPDQIKQKLSKLALSKELLEFIDSGFRLRFKNEILQIRAQVPAFLENCDLEQTQTLREFAEEMELLGIKTKLEYRDCCQSKCFGCQIFD